MPSDFNEFWGIMVAFLGIISVGSGIYITWSNRNKQNVKEAANETAKDTELGISVEYIKRSVDDIRLDLRVQNEKFEKYTQKMDEKYDKLNERVIVVEQSLSSIHKQIDKVERGI